MLPWLIPLFFFAVLMGSPVPGFLVFTGIGVVHAWQSWRSPHLPNAFQWTREDSWLALCFMSIPLFKLLTLLWSPDPKLALGNVAWHLYFLFWPLVLLGLAKCHARQVDVDSGLAAGLVVSALWGLYQVKIQGAPDLGAMGNVGITAQLAMAVGSWCLLALTRPKDAGQDASPAWRWLHALAFVATWVVLVLSTRRLELLGFVGLSVGIVLYRLWPRLRPAQRGWLLGAGLLLGALALSLRWEKFALGFSEIQRYFDSRAKGIPYVDSSWGARLEMWRLGWQAFAEHPLLGISASARAYDMPGAPPMDIFGHRHFHSHLVQALVEGGLLGLVVFAAALWQSSRLLILRPWQTQKETALLAAALLGAYAMEGAASAALVYDKTNAFLAVATAWTWLRVRDNWI